MIRKRNFLLFVLTVLFLIIGISVTIASRLSVSPSGSQLFSDQEMSIPTEAEVITTEIDRKTRAADLREKIASLSGDIRTTPEELIAVDEEEDVEEPIPSETGIEVCETATQISFSIPPGASFKEREGARLLVTQNEIMVEKTVGSSTVEELEVVEEVILQLPSRRLPLPGSSCIGTDVVGIAKDGSLIRNTDAGLYGVFGSETVVGYALDGFPIYGTNDVASLDQCGGVIEAGQYRYYLSSERDTILNCYSGIPVSF